VRHFNVLVWSCIRYLLILSASAWLGRYLTVDPGYVVIQYHGYTIETSVFFVLLLLLLIATLMLIMKQLLQGVSGSGLLRALFPNRKRAYQQQWFTAISYKLAEQPQAAAEAFTKAHHQHPILPLLLTAIYHIPLDQPADALIEKAYIEHPEHTDWIDMLFIHRLIQKKQYQAALEKLQQLPKTVNGPAKDYFLLTCYRDTNQWNMAKPLLKSRFLSIAQKQLLENSYYTYLLHHTPIENLKKTWRSLPAYCKKRAIFLDCYAERLANHDQIALAMKIVERALSEQVDPILINRYANLYSNNTAAQLQFLLTLLTQHPQYEPLIMAIATLYQKQGEPLKSLVYMEKILEDTQTISVLLAGAALYQSLNRDTHAQTIYQRIQQLQP